MAHASLHNRLRGPIATALKKELKIDNVHALPKLQKVVVNVGINKTKMDGKEMYEYIEDSLSRITGQKPKYCLSRKAISNFKIRQGAVVGAMVTLRGHRMEEFVDRLISYALPRIRDFRGLPDKLDGRGNYAIGILDHSIFPEIPPPDTLKVFGLQVQFCINARNDNEAKALLKAIGVPFRPKKPESASHHESS
ncbi:50S ribosomal protein L5 [Candidatus Peregrinibacteria bacterium CG10_big_fil_rev_8_21_14_0_10_49_16]|nr:MAG: 50S ribosomal protein L5 [Candidatus Peregrinibacteria bacterium CG22_combo_CG10-13_8_21_14_all_49_11]PIR51835.1 MAG: 50S ribosomal protein L5 [Candidatus Peregrinibacteria bacterium CG10_big_fil_rev_8_21_14_0_10_49_16]